MKTLMNAGEFLVGVVILLITLVCIAVAGVISLTELPRYWQRTQK